jgi:hypothetical protein
MLTLQTMTVLACNSMSAAYAAVMASLTVHVTAKATDLKQAMIATATA